MSSRFIRSHAFLIAIAGTTGFLAVPQVMAQSSDSAQPAQPATQPSYEPGVRSKVLPGIRGGGFGASRNSVRFTSPRPTSAPGGYAFPNGTNVAPRIIDPVRYIRVPGTTTTFVVSLNDDGTFRSRFYDYSGAPYYRYPRNRWGQVEFPDDYRVRGIYPRIDPILSGAYNNQIAGQTPDPSVAAQAPQQDYVDFESLSLRDQGEMLMEVGDVKRALGKLKEHLDTNPEDTRTARTYALALMLDGSWDQGFGILHLAYSNNPSLANEPVPMELLGVESDRELSRWLRDAVRAAHDSPSAGAWLSVLTIMQLEDKPVRVLERQLARAEDLGLEPAIATAMRQALDLPAAEPETPGTPSSDTNGDPA